MREAKNVTPRQAKALESAGGEALAEAAMTMGVTPATLVKWMAEPAFVSAYRAARRAALEMDLARLARSAGGAVEALGRALTCGSPAVEVAAARATIELATRAVEIYELAGQLAEIQRVHDARGGVPVPADGGGAGGAGAGDDDPSPLFG